MNFIRLVFDKDYGWIIEEYVNGEWEHDPSRCFKSCKAATRHARERADELHCYLECCPRRGGSIMIAPRKPATVTVIP